MKMILENILTFLPLFILQIIGAVLAYRFRNLQDPGKAQATANPLYAPQYS